MKKYLALVMAAMLLLAGCRGGAEPSGTAAVPPQTTLPAGTVQAEPVVVSDVERQTAQDGTEYVTSLIETTYPDGSVTVEAKSEIFYTDGSVFCESQLSIYHVDGSKTVELRTTQTDAEGSVTVLEQQTLEYAADGQLAGEK